MYSTRILQAIGALGIVSGGILIWYGFQRQMCSMVGGPGDHCSPNIVYLLPGILIVFVGISLLVFLHRRDPSDSTETSV